MTQCKEFRDFPDGTIMATGEQQLCFQCDDNPRDPGDFLCWSCKEEHKLCYECGERERNLPFKLCTPCYKKASKKSAPIDGIISPSSATIVPSSGDTASDEGKYNCCGSVLWVTVHSSKDQGQ